MQCHNARRMPSCIRDVIILNFEGFVELSKALDECWSMIERGDKKQTSVFDQHGASREI